MGFVSGGINMEYLTNNSIKCDKCNLFKIGKRVEQCKCESEMEE